MIVMSGRYRNVGKMGEANLQAHGQKQQTMCRCTHYLQGEETDGKPALGALEVGHLQQLTAGYPARRIRM